MCLRVGVECLFGRVTRFNHDNALFPHALLGITSEAHVTFFFARMFTVLHSSDRMVPDSSE